jgi:hypothetical protein
MAAVDKIYGTHEQYKEFRSWCYENKNEALQYFYLWDTDDKYSHVICLLPEELDLWMLHHCTLEWVVESIREQYGLLTMRALDTATPIVHGADFETCTHPDCVAMRETPCQ